MLNSRNPAQRADIAPTDGYELVVDGHFNTQFVEEGAAKKVGRVACEVSDVASRNYDASSKSRALVKQQ